MDTFRRAACSSLGRLLCAAVLALPTAFCSLHRLTPEEVQRNRIFAEVLKREDRRDPGTDGFLHTLLRDSPEPQVQQWSAQALGRIGLPRTLPWLYEGLQAPHAAVRAACAFAIGEVEDRDTLRELGLTADPEAVRRLIQALDDSSSAVQIRAIEALGKIGDPSAAVQIRARTHPAVSAAPVRAAWLSAAATAFIRLQDPESFPLLREMASVGGQAQWSAVSALVRLRDKGARPLFLDLLRNAAPDVRAYAVRGIGICGNPDDSRLLWPLIAAADSAGARQPLSVRVSALQALGMLREPASAGPIAAALDRQGIARSEPDAVNFAAAAAAALGSIGSRSAEQSLTWLAGVPGPVSESALVALAQTCRDAPERFFENCDTYSRDSRSGARAWADALGELGGPLAARELKDALARSLSSEENAESAALPFILRALARTGAPELRDVLRTYLGSRDHVVLRYAAEAYRTHPEARRAWEPVLAAYRGIQAGNDPETKVALLNCLEPWAAEPDVRSFLLGVALEDRVRNARIAAARLLRLSRAPDVPEEPGAAETRATDIVYGMAAGARKDRSVAVLHTSRGDVEIALFREDAPLTVSNFVLLSKSGFYNGLRFMRVAPHFVVQTGDPRNDQEGGPGYSLRCEINMRPFGRGSVGMALAGKDTGGSQFFVTLSAQPHLDGGYTCFGRVISGMQVVERLTAADRILSIDIEEDAAMLDYRRF